MHNKIPPWDHTGNVMDFHAWPSERGCSFSWAFSEPQLTGFSSGGLTEPPWSLLTILLVYLKFFTWNWWDSGLRSGVLKGILLIFLGGSFVHLTANTSGAIYNFLVFLYNPTPSQLQLLFVNYVPKALLFLPVTTSYGWDKSDFKPLCPAWSLLSMWQETSTAVTVEFWEKKGSEKSLQHIRNLWNFLDLCGNYLYF